MSKSKKKKTLKCEECGFETEDQDELEEHKRNSTQLHRNYKTVIKKNTFFKTNVEFLRQYEVDTIDADKERQTARIYMSYRLTEQPNLSDEVLNQILI